MVKQKCRKVDSDVDQNWPEREHGADGAPALAVLSQLQIQQAQCRRQQRVLMEEGSGREAVGSLEEVHEVSAAKRYKRGGLPHLMEQYMVLHMGHKGWCVRGCLILQK